MATIYTHQSQNVRRTWALMTGFFVLIVGLGFVFSQVYGDPNILWLFFAISIVMNIASYWFSDKIALSVSGAKPADEIEYLELHRLVENLAITAGLPKPKVYIINDPAPNAFATGRNKDHAAVAFTTGILSMLDRTELEGVTAHELAHIGNRDILLSTVVVVLVGLISLVADLFLRNMLWGGGRSNNDNDRGNGLMILLGIVFAILSPIVATMIQLAVSRKREYLADASGALLTRYPEGLASALEKISAYGRPMQRASTATAHMFISNPFGSRAARGLQSLFMTHPPTEKRVAALREM
jgi:heat shock protein HtpX